jgi:hypothetical protein
MVKNRIERVIAEHTRTASATAPVARDITLPESRARIIKVTLLRAMDCTAAISRTEAIRLSQLWSSLISVSCVVRFCGRNVHAELTLNGSASVVRGVTEYDSPFARTDWL